MKRPVITILTDFGSKDHYVASMKGTILKINPDCTLIDITHHVNLHQIKEGAFILANAYGSFPQGTIHIAVVDPGVGSTRRPIIFVTQNYILVGPDNGLFSFVLKRERVKKAIILEHQGFFLSRISTTFHGRDIFAPVAAHLSLGIKPEDLGPKVYDWVELDFPALKLTKRKLSGEVLHNDIFGNLITNITEEDLSHFVGDRSFVIRIGERVIHGLKKAYWEVEKDKLMALIGSGGFLEISVRENSAQKRLKVKKGDQVTIEIDR